MVAGTQKLKGSQNKKTIKFLTVSIHSRVPKSMAQGALVQDGAVSCWPGSLRDTIIFFPLSTSFLLLIVAKALHRDLIQILTTLTE